MQLLEQDYNITFFNCNGEINLKQIAFAVLLENIFCTAKFKTLKVSATAIKPFIPSYFEKILFVNMHYFITQEMALQASDERQPLQFHQNISKLFFYTGSQQAFDEKLQFITFLYYFVTRKKRYRPVMKKLQFHSFIADFV